MAIRRYLAMTEEEFHNPTPGQWSAAWMACHFSPYGSGLTNLPQHLPKGSLLILNDRIPPMHYDVGRIYSILEQIVYAQSCFGLLLDFQRRECSQLQTIANKLIKLPCPVAVSLPYARSLSGPVFLPPVPILTPLADYLSPWAGREIWLEASLSPSRITVDTQGSKIENVPYSNVPLPYQDDSIFCHYKLTLLNDRCEFHLQRTRQDLDALLFQAEKLGASTVVGLWQELK